MASQQSFIDYILDQISGAGSVSAKKMFGEYALYCDNKVVALVCNDQLYVKPTKAGKEFIGSYQEGFPYPGAKPYLVIPNEQLEDNEWVEKLIKISAQELPLPKKKTGKKSLKSIRV